MERILNMRKYVVSGLAIVLSLGLTSMAQEQKPTPTDTQTPAATQFDQIKLPSVDTAEYWVVRTQAVTELTSFMTKKRSEVKAKLGYFKDYIDQIGKTDEAIVSNMQGADDPKLRLQVLGVLDNLESKNIPIPQKPLSWEELVEFAMKFVLNEGYLPVTIEGQEELDNFKKILERKEQFCIKVRKDAEAIVVVAVKSWLYLGTIDKQQDFRLYMLNRKQQEKQAVEDQRRAILDDKVAADRQRREQEKQNIWQNRQDRLQERTGRGYGYGYYY
jgi:hypothetical protein